MTLEARRAQLVEELDTLVSIALSPGFYPQRDAAGNPLEGSFVAELERRIREKAAELDAINARMNSFSYQFWAVSHGLLLIVWLCAASMCLASVTLAPLLGPGYLLLFGALAIASLAWAGWASVVPSV